MKTELFNQEFNKMFTWFTNESDPGLLKFEFDIQKKLLNFFMVGSSYYFIMNHHSLTFDMVSKEFEEVLGYSPSEFNFQFLNEKLHPDDMQWFLAFGQK